MLSFWAALTGQKSVGTLKEERSKETETPEGGQQGLATQIPREEFYQRQQAARNLAKKHGFDALLAVSRFFDRPGHVLYLANHYPPFPVVWTTPTNRGRGYAMVLLPVDKDPVLLVDTVYYRRDLVAVENVRVNPNLTAEAVKAIKDVGLQDSRIGLVGEDVLTVTLYKDLTTGLPGVQFDKADWILEGLRARKSATELAIMREAVAVADAGMEEMLNHVKPGVSERELFAIGVYAALKRGATYARPRIMSGPTSGDMALRWPPATDRRLEEGDVVVIDYWGYYNDYVFDINRTAAVGRVDSETRALLESGLRATDLVIEHMAPGKTGDELARLAEEFYRGVMEEHPRFKTGYHGHQIGHGIGLESEAPRLCKGETAPLEPGHVVCVEPGLYVPGFAGVRIEEEVIVTETGVEVITQSRRVNW